MESDNSNNESDAGDTEDTEDESCSRVLSETTETQPLPWPTDGKYFGK